jgi:tRNA(adenine34) deaminase
MTDEELMGLALEQARAAAEIGEVPVGAVVVVDGAVVSAAHNRRQADSDPSAHAELLALRAACAAAGSWRLPDAQVVVTLEPCPMCAGALVAARVGRVVFGAPDPKAGALGSLYNLGADPRLPHELVVRAGVRADECGELLRSFFVDRRPAG